VRTAIPIVSVLALILGLAVVKWLQIDVLMKAGKAAQVAGPPPEVVSSAKAELETWEATLSAVGSVESAKGVTVSNDAPGVVASIHFDSGAHVKKGAVVLELDAGVERAQLAAAKNRRALAQKTVVRTRALYATGAAPASQLDNDESAIGVAEGDVGQLVAQIERKTVRAPFDGRLGIRLVNIGQYLSPGTPITDLQSNEAPVVDFTLPQEHQGEVSTGLAVRMTLANRQQGTMEGKISAIDPAADPISRAFTIRATANDPGAKLRPGMFVNVVVVLPKTRQVVAVPATAIVHAAYGDSVFVIEDKTGQDGTTTKIVRQQFVRVGESRGDFVALDEGLSAGAVVVVAGAFKLRNGMRVVIDDAVKPNPQLSPRPQNH